MTGTKITLNSDNLFISFLLLIFISCSSPESPKQHLVFFESIKPILEGKTIGTRDQSIEIKPTMESSFYYYGKNVLSKGKVQEVILYIKSQHIEDDYKEIRNWYNALLNDSLQDTRFNSWQTDSLDYLLFKKSDSSIFVNIFLKKHH